MADDGWNVVSTKPVSKPSDDGWNVVNVKPAAPAPSMPAYDAMGNVTGGTEGISPVAPEAREFEKKAGPLGYVKEYGKGALATILGTPAEFTVNLPNTIESMAAKLTGTKLKPEDAIPRVGYGIKEASEMLGKPVGDVGEGMRETGEILGVPTGPLATRGAQSVLRGVKSLWRATGGKGYGYLKGVEDAARGEAVLKDAEELRGSVKSQAAGKAASVKAESAAAAAQKAKHEAELNEIEKIQHQIAEREQVRAAQSRDVRQAPDPASVTAIREAVTTKMRDRVRDAERAAREAGLTEQEARAHAVEQERKIVDAENAARTIEEEHLVLPTTDAVTLGKQIQAAAAATEEKYIAAREQGAKFGEAIEKDGDKIVRTNAVDAYIKEAARDTANPELVSAFKFIEKNIKNELEGGAVAKGMTLRKANSLRKQLDSIISSKQLKLENGVAVGLDAETLHHIRQVRRLLNKSAFQTSKDYEQALINFRKLSRPLDQFQRKGALKDIVAKDSLSDDFIKAHADVVGAVLRREKGGKSVFAELVKQDPTLVDSAKMYFHNELFGAGDTKKVPTIAALRAFIAKNERVLTELGIYDDFATLKSAREAGQQAIERARGEFEAAKSGVKSAEQLSKEALAKVADESRLRSAAVKRQEAATKGIKTPEDVAKEAATKAKEAESSIKTKAKETESKIRDLSAKKAAAEDKVLSYRGDINEIGAGDARTSMSQARSLARKLLDDHVIDEAQHGALVKKIADINAKFKEKDEASRHIKNVLLYVVGTIGAAGLASFGIDHIRRIVF